eukprot:CFRG7224T1
MVQKLTSSADFKEIVGGDKLVVIDFFAVWCGPCKVISPFVESLEEKYANVSFVKVDVDELEELAGECGIQAMPTFQFYKGGKKVAELKGANKEKLEDLVKQHA